MRRRASACAHALTSVPVDAGNRPVAAGEDPRLVALPARTATQRLRLLLRLSEALAGATTVDQVADTITQVAAQYLGAMFGGVAMLEPTSGDMQFVSLDQLPESLRDSRRRFTLSSSRPAARVARERRALFIASLDDAARVMDADSAAAARESGAQAFAYVPMLAGSTVVGAVALIWPEPRTFTPADQTVLWALARYGGQALERARLLIEQREVAHTLQVALLPPVLPEFDWVLLHAVYEPARRADAVGGDWYDAFISVAPETDRPWDQTLTAVIGDVAGHDTRAAAEMGRLQAKLRALAIDRPDEPHRLLQRLDRVMTANIHNRHATALVANLAPRSDGGITLSWSNAGHLPPLLLEPGSPPRYLDRAPDRLLGLKPADADRHTHAVVLSPGAVLLMFTDGLVERRGDDLDDSLERFARLAEQHRTLPLAEMIDALLAATSADDHDDDTVLFGLQVP